LGGRGAARGGPPPRGATAAASGNRGGGTFEAGEVGARVAAELRHFRSELRDE
jgi:hypothetical protein